MRSYLTRDALVKWAPVIVLIVLVLFFALMEPRFFSVRNFARSWILDLKERRIRVNAVSPGLTETAGLNELFGGGNSAEQTKAQLADQIPAGRIGQPEETAKAVLFLASDEASFVNGIELFVDGGQNQI